MPNLVNTLKLYNDATNRKLVKSELDGSAVTFPRLVEGDTLSIYFKLLEENPGNFSQPYTIILPSAYSLKIGVFKETGEVLAFQSSFTDNNTDKAKEGVLNLATSQIQTELIGKRQINVMFEIEIVDASGNIATTYQTAAVILKNYITQEMITIPVEDTAATVNWTLGTFVKKSPTTYEPLTFVTPAGYKYLLWIDDNGMIKTQKII